MNTAVHPFMIEPKCCARASEAQHLRSKYSMRMQHTSGQTHHSARSLDRAEVLQSRLKIHLHDQLLRVELQPIKLTPFLVLLALLAKILHVFTCPQPPARSHKVIYSMQDVSAQGFSLILRTQNMYVAHVCPIFVKVARISITDIS